jgi:hypothetical protein
MINIISPLGVRAGYINGRRLAAFRLMKLPPHTLHDDYLYRSEKWKSMRNYSRVCSRELLAYPQRDGRFQSGKDVIDSESGWLLPASYLSKANQEKEVFGERVGLFIDPGKIAEENGRMIVHPASMMVLHGMLQRSGLSAKVDEATRIPLRMSHEAVSPDDELRAIWRVDGVGIRPIVRAVSNCSLERRFSQVFTDFLPDELFDITGVIDWLPAPKPQ